MVTSGARGRMKGEGLSNRVSVWQDESVPEMFHNNVNIFNTTELYT